MVHIDVATDDGLTIRISFSNMFKEFKSTSTWLQFPFVSSPPPGSVDEVTVGEASVLSSKSNNIVNTLLTNYSLLINENKCPFVIFHCLSLLLPL